MLDVSAAEQATMLNAVRKIQQAVQRSIVILKCDRFLAEARWRMVEDMTEVEYPYKGMVNEFRQDCEILNSCFSITYARAVVTNYFA